MPANRPFWDLMTRRNVHIDTATELYGRLVALARSRPFYADLGVPDSPEGRLELLMLHVVLMLRRLGREGDAAAPVARALSERFVTDMDDCLREMGVGDVAVARKVKKAAAALMDRMRDYSAVLATGDNVGLAKLIAAHVTRADEPTSSSATTIAAYTMEMEAALTAAPLDALIAGTATLPTLTD